MRRLTVAALVSAVLGVGLALPDAATFPSDDAAIVHVLNRIGFGPRPGAVEKSPSDGVAADISNGSSIPNAF